MRSILSRLTRSDTSDDAKSLSDAELKKAAVKAIEELHRRGWVVRGTLSRHPWTPEFEKRITL